MSSTMRELPPAERPRERLLNQGAGALKTAELIAILLRTGTSERPVLDLAEFLLSHFGSLEALSRAPVGELMKIKGVGQAKAIELKAAFALAARLARSEAEARAINTPEDIALLLGDEMRLLDYESVRVIA
jgi:DNA repair protein RadC